MADDAARFDLLDAARLMQELALAYGDNHDEAPAELIRQFEAAAAGLAEEIGEVEITNEDDEELVLTAGGHFTGRVHAEKIIKRGRMGQARNRDRRQRFRTAAGRRHHPGKAKPRIKDQNQR